MSKNDESNKEFTQAELVKLANELDKTVAKPKSEKIALTVGVYVAQITKTYLFKAERTNSVYLNFGFNVRGFLSQNEMGQDEVVPREFGNHTKGYSLNKDFCVNMLLDLYRDLDVRRTDGEGVVYGGDILRSRGIPEGTWVVIKVRNNKAGDGAFISSVFAPTSSLLANIKSVFEEENDNNQNEEFDNDNDETGNPPF